MPYRNPTTSFALRRQGSRTGVFEGDDAGCLSRATDSLHAHLSRHVEAAGLTMGQFAVLEALLHLGPMSQREIGAKLLRSGSNTTMVVDNLQQRGFVKRRRRTDDRRAIEVSLSPAGRRLIAELFPQHARRITRLFTVLSRRDQQRLAALCKTLGRSIPGKEDA